MTSQCGLCTSKEPRILKTFSGICFLCNSLIGYLFIQEAGKQPKLPKLQLCVVKSPVGSSKKVYIFMVWVVLTGGNTQFPFSRKVSMQTRILTSFRQNEQKSVTCGWCNFCVVVPFMFSILCGQATSHLFCFLLPRMLLYLILKESLHERQSVCPMSHLLLCSHCTVDICQRWAPSHKLPKATCCKKRWKFSKSPSQAIGIISLYSQWLGGTLFQSASLLGHGKSSF